MRSPAAEKSFQWRQANPQTWKLHNLRSKLKCKFGMTIEEYEAKFTAQKGRCACCGDPIGDVRAPRGDLDHDHKTGKVRDLLCRQCNTALGSLRESPARIIALLHYVQRHNQGV
jgi:ribosomal protein L34E